MRRLNKYFRHRNPGAKDAALRGAKKHVHGDLLEILSRPRRKNPGRQAGQQVDAFNLLGRLNQLIAAGETEYIPLRDTIAANIEGNLSTRALDYSITEALTDLSTTEVRVIQEMIADLGGDASPEEGAEIRRAARRHPDVQRAERRVEAAEKALKRSTETFRRAYEEGLLESRAEAIIGTTRFQAMKEQDLAAEKEAGRVVYRPRDPKLWDRVQKALDEKFPHRYIPPKLDSTKREEFRLLLKLAHKNTPKSEKRTLKKRLQTAHSNRWRTATILAYERAGGTALSQAEVEARKAQRMKKLGVPFPLGPGFFGVIKKSRQYDWYLVDKSGTIYMSGDAASKNSASRDVAIAYRVISNLAILNEQAGWDNLGDNDRRWLDDHKPKLSARVARVLLQHVNERRKVSKTTARWLVSAAELGTVKTEGKEDVKQSCKNMTLGEERIFPGPKRAYSIHVIKGTRGRFTFFVETKDGKRSQTRRSTDCDEVVRRGHLVGGAMTGALEVSRAMSNPAKIKRLENSARRYFAKKNPKMPRAAADVSDIRELTGMVGIPENAEDAYRYGFYAGIIRGIDTCGVQNYMKRKRIRDTFQSRLLSAAMETTARVTGTRQGKVERKRSPKHRSTSYDDIDIDSLRDSLLD